MKIFITILRILMGALLIFSSLAYFFNLIPQPELSGNVKAFMEGMLATGYMMTLIKITELVCGIAFLFGRYVALALVVIAPIVINIFLFHIFVVEEGLPIAIFLVFTCLLLAHRHWDKYRPLFQAR